MLGGSQLTSVSGGNQQVINICGDNAHVRLTRIVDIYTLVSIKTYKMHVVAQMGIQHFVPCMWCLLEAVEWMALMTDIVLAVLDNAIQDLDI
ncbi:hypothetical protein H4S00_005740 [Coemansia sp. D1744]|nr:hypothetical protein H4S00_005740 [Coemansia sp. D1744]